MRLALTADTTHQWAERRCVCVVVENWQLNKSMWRMNFVLAGSPLSFKLIGLLAKYTAGLCCLPAVNS